MAAQAVHIPLPAVSYPSYPILVLFGLTDYELLVARILILQFDEIDEIDAFLCSPGCSATRFA